MSSRPSRPPKNNAQRRQICRRKIWRNLPRNRRGKYRAKKLVLGSTYHYVSKKYGPESDLERKLSAVYNSSEIYANCIINDIRERNVAPYLQDPLFACATKIDKKNNQNPVRKIPAEPPSAGRTPSESDASIIIETVRDEHTFDSEPKKQKIEKQSAPRATPRLLLKSNTIQNPRGHIGNHVSRNQTTAWPGRAKARIGVDMENDLESTNTDNIKRNSRSKIAVR